MDINQQLTFLSVYTYMCNVMAAYATTCTLAISY